MEPLLQYFIIRPKLLSINPSQIASTSIVHIPVVNNLTIIQQICNQIYTQNPRSEEYANVLKNNVSQLQLIIDTLSSEKIENLIDFVYMLLKNSSTKNVISSSTFNASTLYDQLHAQLLKKESTLRNENTNTMPQTQSTSSNTNLAGSSTLSDLSVTSPKSFLFPTNNTNSTISPTSSNSNAPVVQTINNSNSSDTPTSSNVTSPDLQTANNSNSSVMPTSNNTDSESITQTSSNTDSINEEKNK